MTTSLVAIGAVGGFTTTAAFVVAGGATGVETSLVAIGAVGGFTVTTVFVGEDGEMGVTISLVVVCPPAGFTTTMVLVEEVGEGVALAELSFFVLSSALAEAVASVFFPGEEVLPKSTGCALGVWASCQQTLPSSAQRQ
jgi:hypothetical protein